MKKQESTFANYMDMYKTWESIFTSWPWSMSSKPFFRVEMGNSLNPFHNYFGDWNRMYKNFAKTMAAFPHPYGSMNEYSQSMMQGIGTYVKLYEMWLRSMDKISRKQFDLMQGMTIGKEVNVDEIFDIINESRAEIIDTVLKSTEGIPFKGVFKGSEEISKALKQFAASFPEEQKRVKEFFQTFSTYYIKTINSWTSHVIESSRSFSDMLARGEVSVDAYSSLINTCGMAYKESAGTFLGTFSSLLPAYHDMANDLTAWTNAYINLISSWIEIPLRVIQGIGTSSKELWKFSDETFRKNEMESSQYFYSSWLEFYKKASVDLTDNVQFSLQLPKFVNALTDYIRATNNVYERTLKPVFPTKGAMDEMNARIDEISAMADVKEQNTKKAIAIKKSE